MDQIREAHFTAGQKIESPKLAMFTFSVNFPRQPVAFLGPIIAFVYHGAAVVACLECAHWSPKNQIDLHVYLQKTVPLQSFHQIFAHRNCGL